MVTELNIERKKRVRMRRIRRLVMLLLLCVLMIAAVYARPLLEGVSVSAFLQEAFGTVGRSGSFPVALVGETASAVYNLGGSAAVLTDTRAAVFSPAGRPSASVQNGFAEGVCKVSGSRAILYGRGAKGITLLGKGGELSSTKLDEIIVTAEVAANGRVAAATPSSRHAACVRVFDSAWNALLTWYSAENQVLSLALSPDASRLAVGTVTAEDGALLSAVKLFSIADQEEICEARLSETLVLALKYVAHGVQAVCDNQVVYLDETGKNTGSYSYGGKPLAAYSFTGSSTALVLGEYKTERQESVVSLGKDGTVNFALVVHEQVRDVYTNAGFTYVLTDTALTVYNQSGQEQFAQPNERGWIAVAANGENLYLLLPHGVEKLTAAG
ncbi:MAG: DUF5711 family protein [Acetanaerobacterium sp.]